MRKHKNNHQIIAKLIKKIIFLIACLVVVVEHTEVADSQDQLVKEIGVLVVGTVPAYGESREQGHEGHTHTAVG